MNNHPTNIRASFDAFLAPSLTVEFRGQLQAISENIDLRADQAFVVQGQGSEYLYFFGAGIVRYYIIDQDGKEANKTFTLAPRIVGSTRALLTGEPCRLNLAPLEGCQGLKINWRAFRELTAKNLEVAHFYTSGLEQLFVMKEERESSFLLSNAEQRLDKFLVDHAGFWHKIPQYHIASYLGITPVYLSRILRSRRP